ncbi:MAG: hypothetical protein P4M15_05810 [Alphaproteobacteria bacterium]|nr:hypothetical protein [Alphaproteobacteria bacterium]
MSLPRHLFTPAFRHHHLGKSFGMIVSIMVFIASFATVAEAGLLALGYNWGQTMESRITVEIPAVDDEAATPQSTRVEQAIAAIRALPQTGLVLPLSDSEVEKLLQPWFSDAGLLKTLPLPTLIDVERKPGADLTAAQISDVLKDVVADAKVDDHGAWTQDVWRLVHGLAMLGGLMITLTGVALVIAVSLMCRAVMAAEHETVALLHTLGTDDRDIARHFQLQAERIALRAAGIGFAGALTVTAALMFATRHIADLSTLHLSHWIELVAAALAVPVAAIAIAAFTARETVMKLIRALP